MDNHNGIFKDALFPCPLCERDLNIKLSKKNKPYVVCDLCGVQLFIRKKEGINILINYLQNKGLF
jgi:transcription elongation factor Elf1